MNILRSERGISIVEAIVAVGVMSMAAYFFMEIMRTGTVSQKTLQAQDDARVLTENIAALLSDPVACENTFAGISGSPNPPPGANPVAGQNVTNIVDSSKKVQFTLNGIYGNRSLKLISIRIGGLGIDDKTQLHHWSPGPPAPALPSGVAFVQIHWQQNGSAAGSHTGTQDLNRYFMVSVTNMAAAPANTIISCAGQAGGGAQTSYWSPSMTGDDIYNNNGSGVGKVGIGTTTPLAALDVEGVNGVILNAGKVGVGTKLPVADLEVAGTFRAAAQAFGTPCTVFGALASDSFSGAPLYCSNTTHVWTPVAMVCHVVTVTGLVAACASNETLMNGGCACVDDPVYSIQKSYPTATVPYSWVCQFSGCSGPTTYATCCHT